MAGEILKVCVIAGEASGDLLGGRLMEALCRQSDRPIEFCGIGGTEMEKAGLSSLFPMDELSIMGLVEILPKLRHLMRRVRETVDLIREARPDVLITIDSPGFAHQLVKKLGTVGFPKIHYVAPSVWAWKPGRVHKFKKHFDHLLALLPIEPPYFEQVGLPCHFVGHSILESGADKGNGIRFRQKNQVPEDVPLLCLLPGSRRGEIARLMPEFTRAVEMLRGREPELRVVLPTIKACRKMVEVLTAGWERPPLIVEAGKDKYDAMAASNVALAASGTVALELALARVPTVIAYRMAPLTHYLVRRLVKVDYAHLLNILLGREVVPEMIQGDCQAVNLAADLAELLGPSGMVQIQELAPALEMLKAPEGANPSDCAAAVVLRVLNTNITG